MKTKDMDLSLAAAKGGATRKNDVGAAAAADDDSDSDNKYEKIRRRKAQFRRTLLTIVAMTTAATGMLHLYYNSSNNFSGGEGGGEGGGNSYQQLLQQLGGGGDESSTGNKKNVRAAAVSSSTARSNQKQGNKDANINSERIQQLEEAYSELDKEVRAIKATGIIMETDEHSKEVTGKLQEAARALLLGKYGNPPYRLKMDLEFQESKKEPTIAEGDRHATLLVEMAPIDLIPYSVYNFLEIARGYKGGGFHRNAGHVLQAAVRTKYVKDPLAFQEYSPNFPHVKGTVGYCGRPSGVCWYVSIIDNSQNHGPGSQQKENPHEADANFGKVIEGMDDVVPRIHSTMIRNKFLNDKKDWVLVNAMHILVSDGQGGFKEWQQ